MPSRRHFIHTAITLARFRAKGMLTPEMKRLAAAQGFTGLWDDSVEEETHRERNKTSKGKKKARTRRAF